MRYKVVIVDDKPVIVQALVQTIKWSSMDCSVEGQATDAITAKNLIEQIEPDILITDIKMPGMDGLELTEYAKKRLPDLQIIMITGYQEFEYARKALSLGVSDLVLKPIRNDVMEEKVQKVIAELKKIKTMNRTVSISRKALQEQLLYKFLKERDTENFQLAEKAIELGLYKRIYYIILVRVRSDKNSVEKSVWNQVIVWMECQTKKDNGDIFEWISGKNQVLIIFEKEKPSARERKVFLRQKLHVLNERVLEEFGISCCFVVSKISDNLRNLSESWKQVQEVMESVYFSGEQTIVFAESYSGSSAVKNGDFFREVDNFCQSVMDLEGREISEKTQKLIEDIFQETGGNEFRAKCLISEICITFLRRFCMEDQTNELLGKIHKLTGKKSCRDFMDVFLEEIGKKSQRGKMEFNPLIKDAMNYIQIHYKENISLTDLADKMAVNASYLSRLFKKETGKNFSEILTEYRVEKAKILLRHPGCRVVEVAEQVGYSDYTYFYQVFKKIENCSPSDYRKKVKNSNIM